MRKSSLSYEEPAEKLFRELKETNDKLLDELRNYKVVVEQKNGEETEIISEFRNQRAIDLIAVNDENFRQYTFVCH